MPSGVTVEVGASAPFPITLPVPAPAGGVTVSFVSSDPSKVTITPATVSIVAGQTTPVPQPVVNGIAAGSASISASAPGYLTASQPVTVPGQGGSITVSSITVGRNLQALIEVTLSTPVTGGPLNVSLMSADGSKLLIGSLLDQGLQTKVLQFPVGSTSGVAYAQALAGSGTVTVTASAAGYTSGSGTVTLTPSAFVITGPAGAVGVRQLPHQRGERHDVDGHDGQAGCGIELCRIARAARRILGIGSGLQWDACHRPGESDVARVYPRGHRLHHYVHSPELPVRLSSR